MSKLLCIIPFYNEESRFSSISYDTIISNHPEIDFLLVDDKSTDNTLQLLQSKATNFSNCAIHSLPKNVGKAEAIRNFAAKQIENGRDHC